MIKRTELGATAGVTLRREALDMGYDDRSIAAMVKNGRWVKIRHGSYVDARLWSPLGAEDRHRVTARAVLKTARSPVVLSHVSAAVEWGADGRQFGRRRGPDHAAAQRAPGAGQAPPLTRP